MLLFSCTKIFCRNIYNTVCIDIKCNFDLRNTSSCWRDTVQTELSKGFVVFCKLSFTLYYMDIYCSLVICCCREYLALLCRDRCVTLDQLRSYAAQCFDRQGKRSNIQKKDIACTGISCKFTTLNGSTKCYTLIRVQALVRFMSCQLFYFILNCRDTCRTTNQKDFRKLACGKSCIFQCILYRNDGCIHKVMCQFIKFCSCQIHLKVLRTCLICCDERKVNVCCCRGRQFFLCLLCSLSQSLESHLIVRKVDTFFCLEICDHVICDLLIEVITTKPVVTVCSQNLDNAVTDLNDRYIECTAAKVVYHDLLFFFIVKSVCKSCSCRLVDDTFYIKACDLTCIFCSLTLCIVEICRYCDNCFCYLLAKIILSI